MSPYLSLVPAGTETTASSRIRVFSLQRELVSRGVRAVLGVDDEADVLYIQKRVDHETLAAAQHFKSSRRLVIYDCDDLGPALHEIWAPEPRLITMLALADVITTNTAAFKCLLHERYAVKVVELVPDIVDYFLPSPVKAQPEECAPLQILWFGNRGNLHLLHNYTEALYQIENLSLVVCTDPAARDYLNIPFPFRFEAWTLDGFPRLLQQCQLTFLPHDGRVEDRAKSNNRMITSIAWGVPAIVSRTPEYEALAHAIREPGCIVDGPGNLQETVESVRSVERRRQYLSRAVPAVWARHSPKVVGDRFLQVITSHLEAHRQKQLTRRLAAAR